MNETPEEFELRKLNEKLTNLEELGLWIFYAMIAILVVAVVQLFKH